MMVVLPEPLAPTRATISLGRARKEMFFSTGTWGR